MNEKSKMNEKKSGEREAGSGRREAGRGKGKKAERRRRIIIKSGKSEDGRGRREGRRWKKEEVTITYVEVFAFLRMSSIFGAKSIYFYVTLHCY